MNDTAISLRLGAWWEANARDLPWRFGRATPWGVLVSEVMSQQTQMSRVVPYWTDWMERWPDARALAEAPKAEVITASRKAAASSQQSRVACRFAGMQGSFDGNCSTGSGAVAGTVGRAGSAFCTGRLTVCGSKDRFSSGLVCS